MPSSPSSSAQAARAAVAARLRELRLDAGLTGKELAVRCGWHPAKTSRLENALTPPSDDDIRSWCATCDAAPSAPDLIAATRAVDSMYMEWRRLHRTGLKRTHETSVPLYERTCLFRVYCSTVIPGLVQTPSYAEALMASITRFQGTPDDVAEAVAARIARSHVIHDGDHRFALLIEEAVLYYRVGDPQVMAGQLGYLLAAMSSPSVSLGVIPFTAERPVWTLEAFNMFDDDQVLVELLTAAVTVTSPREIEDYGRAFAELSRMAVYGARARSLITAAIAALG
ncbi:transcriptional regulator with XRE-family HTH domain [Streptacidiphilus sp. MAP12-16]|jgi:transcriptional regulator with XRE-family HTH domain|uniref:helix-turn-helix domain-containing protein n=1 Tax=Streptacidiphilus sp. MAP12-16 TaxID=3156300 RepID=UPI003517041F